MFCYVMDQLHRDKTGIKKGLVIVTRPFGSQITIGWIMFPNINPLD